MGIQWYPGHMAKAKRMMQDNLKLVDVIIELVDARIPFSSKNPDIDNLANNKSRIILLNKYDMADDKITDEWKEYYQDKGFFVSLINSKSGQGVKQVKNLVAQACKEKLEANRRKGIINRPMRAMIVGIPNVGKSTFINSFVGRASAKTGNRPGVTKGKQWIRLSKEIELLDTPGILWPKIANDFTGLALAFIGSVNDNIIQMVDLSLDLIIFLSKNYPDSLVNRYDIEIPKDVDNHKEAAKHLEAIGLKRGCIIKGGQVDFERAANILLDDFRNARLGKISLERPSTIFK